MDEKLFDPDDFEKGQIIGNGGFGIVYQAKELKTGKDFAMKVFPELNPDSFKSFKDELQIIEKVNYPTILSFYGYITVPPYSIITEFMPNKSLDYYIKRAYRGETDSCWNITNKIIIIIGICLGMRYLHSLNISHRDLKPGNVLLDENFYPRICDFGQSKYAAQSMSTFVGTPAFQAPEIGSSKFDRKADIFSFAMTLYSILYDTIPFQEINNPYEIYEKISHKGERPSLMNDVVSKEMNKLIEKCWKENPKERPDFDDILKQFITILNSKEKLGQITENYEINIEEIEKIFIFCKEKDFLEFEMTKFQINYNKKILEKSTPNGYSLLHYAAEINQYEIGRKIIKSFFFKRANINAKDIFGSINKTLF